MRPTGAGIGTSTDPVGSVSAIEETRVRSRTQQPPDGLQYLAKPLLAAIAAAQAQVEGELGHPICGRYLGGTDEHPNVCWRAPLHEGSHL